MKALLEQQLLLPLVLLASSLLTTLLGLLLAKLNAWIAAKVKNEALAGALTRLTDAVSTEVGAVQQTVVGDLKASGQFDAATAAKIKADALAQIKSHLGGEAGLAELGQVLGLDSGGLNGLLNSKLEAVVGDIAKALPVVADVAAASLPASAQPVVQEVASTADKVANALLGQPGAFGGMPLGK